MERAAHFRLCPRFEKLDFMPLVLEFPGSCVQRPGVHGEAFAGTRWSTALAVTVGLGIFTCYFGSYVWVAPFALISWLETQFLFSFH